MSSTSGILVVRSLEEVKSLLASANEPLIVPYWFKLFVLTGYAFIVGGYLPVVIYRVPRNMSTVLPRSACASCNEPISLLDIFPVFSWFFLKGKCRSCKASIPIRYPILEASAVVMWIVFAVLDGFHWDLLAYLTVGPAFVCLAVIDWQHHLLPRRIVWITLALTVLFLANAALWDHEWHRFVTAVVAAASAWACFALLRVLGPPGGLGMGDVRLALILGLILGWIGWAYVVVGITLGAIGGAAWAVLEIACRRANTETTFPFGTFLVIGSVVVMIVGLVSKGNVVAL